MRLRRELSRSCNGCRAATLSRTQQTLYGMSVVRAYGRIGGHRRIRTPVVYVSLDQAWPLIRKAIRTRLRHGDTIVKKSKEVDPVIRITFGGGSSEIVEARQRL